jgi:WD40 repeat protein
MNSISLRVIACVAALLGSPLDSARADPQVKELAVLKGSVGDVWQLAFSPDGTKIVACAWRGLGGISVWDLATKKRSAEFTRHRSTEHAVAFSPDGKVVASCTALSGEFIRIWDPETGREVTKFKDEEGSTRLAFSPDGKTLVAGDL